jgi:hypothetical protein
LWKKAVASFENALKREAVIREERVVACNAVEAQRALTDELASIRSKLHMTEASALEALMQTKIAEASHGKCKISLDEPLNARRDHRHFKPGLVDALFTLGSAYREWREKDRLLAAAIDTHETGLKHARAECDAHQQHVRSIQDEITKLTTDVAGQEKLFAQQKQVLDVLRDKLGSAFPARERWVTSPDDRELSSPWADETWNCARTEVLIEALHLHRTFIECVPDKVRKISRARWTSWAGKCRQKLMARRSSPLGQRFSSSFPLFPPPLLLLTGCSPIAVENRSVGF